MISGSYVFLSEFEVHVVYFEQPLLFCYMSSVMAPKLVWCQHFHYELCLSGLDINFKSFCLGLKTDSQN